MSDRGQNDPLEPAVIYCRISRDVIGDGLGIERQEAACRDLAARHGWRVVALYTDNDVSAYSGKRRPEYERMRADLAAGLARRVIVWHTDRLHRRNIELESWITDMAESHGVTVHSVQAGPLDLATPGGQLLARQLGAVAQYESAHKSARLRAKMDQKASRGEWLGGVVPFGWRRVTAQDGRARLELAPEEAALVASGVRAVLAGRALRAVVRDWQASGVPPRRSAEWHRRSVRIALGRWRNAGVHEHRGEPTFGTPADWPPISGVTVDDMRAVRELLAERSDAFGVGNRAEHLLSGIARCHCGELVMAGHVGRNAAQRRPAGRIVYRCPSPGPGHVARKTAPIDDVVLAVVAGRLQMPDAEGLAPSPARGVDVAALRQTVRRERKRLDDLAVMLADGDLDREGYRTARGRVAGRLAGAETALASATRTSPLAPLLAAADPGAAFLAAPLDVQRGVVRVLVEVTIFRGPRGRVPFDPESIRVSLLDERS